MASIKEVICKNCEMFHPRTPDSFYGEKIDGSCNSESGADGPIDGDKSPYDNISFFVTSPATGKRFAVGNNYWANHMLQKGSTCFRATNEQTESRQE